MKSTLLAFAFAALAASCATSTGARPGARPDEGLPPEAGGPDSTAYLAVAGVT